MKNTRIFTLALGLLALGASFSAVSAPIHDAARAGNLQEVSKLIGANGNLVKLKNELGSTPLHIAANSPSPEVVKLLLAKGADVNAKDNNGSTPLHIAAFSGHKENVELLLAKGADVHAKDAKGKTARDYAEMVLNREISAILVIKMLAVPASKK